MQPNRKFLVTTEKSKDGIEYTYNANGILIGFEIKQVATANIALHVLKNLQLSYEAFLSWAKSINATVVELLPNITFEKMWDKHDDKVRSSKKRSLKKWNTMPQAEQVKAYFYHDTYMANKGNADKMYLETYLNKELWNN